MPVAGGGFEQCYNAQAPVVAGSLLVISHDRWFLDTVCTRTWEVVGGGVEQYEGGYADWVYARAERARLADTLDEKRRNLARKELAWLRRGAPARTSKPKFRIQAANESCSAEVRTPPQSTISALSGGLRSAMKPSPRFGVSVLSVLSPQSSS